MHHFGMRHKVLRREGEAPHEAPRRSRYIVALDKVTFVAGIIGPFTALTQVLEIFAKGTAEGVSLAFWVLIFMVTLPWIFYGIAHRDASILVHFLLWEVMNVLVIISILTFS
ncbi:MAG: hypothetical protein NUV59_00255 [Patescibacteria group bacterium]|nr:hypothetical protein [Patescibacteria group bacterium]